MSADKIIMSSLYLFSGLPVQNKDAKKQPSQELLRFTLERGFVFSPVVLANYSESNLLQLGGVVGISGKESNSSFHKSWEKIANASIFQLVIEQILHYYSTYGVEFLTGEEHPECVYIPWESLNIPDETKLTLKIVHGYTLDELREMTVNLLSSGIAIKQETGEACLEILKITKLSKSDIERIRNREFLTILYDSLGILPENPVEFLQYLVYKTTGKPMLIKNRRMISEIKAAVTGKVYLLDKYVETYGLDRLSTIFYRFKPIWLAFKTPYTKSTINRMRKLAIKNHVPVEPQFLDSVTSAKANKENLAKVDNLLSRITLWRKFRIAQALNYRLVSDTDSIVYRIRNGKMFATDFDKNNSGDCRIFLDRVFASISQNISPKVSGKKVYIQPHVQLGLPTTEKQFVGNVPSGTSVEVGEDMIIGVWWKNVHGRVDLDFSLQNLHYKVGWDGAYRNSSRTVLFSGDVTDARNGASELFYLGKDYSISSLAMLNYFNYRADNPIPVKLFLAKEHPGNTMGKNYMVNPKNIIMDFPITITEKQNMLGMVKKNGKNNLAFYFVEGSIGNTITAVKGDYTIKAIEYFESFYSHMLTLNTILFLCGAIPVDSPEQADIDLSLENLTKNTILDLLK